MKKEEASARQVVATHRKARQFYEILETYEAGLSLRGCEVKSLRSGKASLDGCFGREEKGELLLFNFHIPPYQYATGESPDPRRSRKLLMHKAELRRIAARIQTMVPLEVYFRRGWAKVSLALAKGKRGPDRREELKKKDAAREGRRSFKDSYRG